MREHFKENKRIKSGESVQRTGTNPQPCSSPAGVNQNLPGCQRSVFHVSTVSWQIKGLAACPWNLRAEQTLAVPLCSSVDREIRAGAAGFNQTSLS